MSTEHACALHPPTTPTPPAPDAAADLAREFGAELRDEIRDIYQVLHQRGSTDHAIVESCQRTVRLRRELRELRELRGGAC